MLIYICFDFVDCFLQLCLSVSLFYVLMQQPTRSLGKTSVNCRHPSCSEPETEGACCHSPPPVDEPVTGTCNYQWLPWSSAQLQRPWLSLPTMLPGLLNIKHLFVLEAQLLLSLRLSLCTPLCMPVRDCLPARHRAHLDKCFKTSYNTQAGVQTYVFIKTPRQHIPDKQMHGGRRFF